MKILMVTPEFPPNCGGIGYYIFYLTRELLALGLRVKVLVRKDATGNAQYQGIPTEVVRIKGIPPFNNHIFRRYIEEVSFSWRPDVIHVHASSLPVPNTTRPLVVTAHSCIGSITPLFYRPVRDIESLYRNLLFPFYFKVERRLTLSCKVLTVVSRSMADDYRRLYGVEPVVVWNGVDTAYFRPKAVKLKTPRIVFVGALKRGKGLLDLLEAARMIEGQYNALQFLIYGIGPLKKILEKRIKRHALNNFRLGGPISHEDLPEILQEATAVALPSYYEGLPNTILEAMACGVPVIATAVKGNTELVQHGTTGYLVPPRDPAALAAMICRIINEPEKRLSMGLAGRRHIEATFTWKQRARDFIKIYDRLAI